MMLSLPGGRREPKNICVSIPTWFFLIRVLKTEFGFQNTHTVFNEIRVSFKTRMCVLKTKFDFQNTNVVFDHTFQIRYFFCKFSKFRNNR